MIPTLDSLPVLALLARFLLALAVPACTTGPTLAPFQSPTVAPAAAQTAPPAPAPGPVYDEKADGREQIAAALVAARKENRRVLVQWGANWCPWCVLLHGTFLRDKDLAREILYEYDVVRVDVGRRDKHMALAASYGVDLAKEQIPYFTILGADGRVVAQQATGAFETKLEGHEGYDAKAILEFLKKNQAQPWKAEELLAEALLRATREDKRLFLHFGAPWCPWCRRLDAWLAAPENAAILSKEFVELKIDVDRTVGGPDVLARFRRTRAGGIPWFALVDAQGALLADSNGSTGNVGFPYQPAEVQHFVGMLTSSCKRLTGDEIRALAASLNSQREAEERKKAEDKAKQGVPPKPPEKSAQKSSDS